MALLFYSSLSVRSLLGLALVGPFVRLPKSLIRLRSATLAVSDSATWTYLTTERVQVPQSARFYVEPLIFF